MTLEQLVAETRTLRQLPRLMQELGWEPAWEPLPAAFWRSRSAGPTSCWPSALIGRAGPLPWFGVEEKSGETLARSLARILQKRGTVAGIAVLDVESRKLSLCISFETLPVLTFPLTSPNSIQLACLRRLAETQSGGLLARAARVAEAIAGEGIGNRFFAAFETQLDRMADAIDGRFRPDERRSLALLQLNRVLFLYFVQSKGWLDARTDFLRTEIDRCLEGRRHLHRTLLQPLFFGTLNREISRRGKASGKLGRIPFLNGGLFEPHPLERRWQGTLSNAVWQDAFAQLFERFHFTVVEGSVSAVAPDMLGRVFEGVMAPAERRKSGTFYTPPDLVRSLIDESLLALIVERLGHTAVSAARLLHTRDESLHPLLDTLTLLDPAAGSGAFLLGALERLSHLRHSGRAGIWLTRRKVLLRSIYGVDVNPTAVRLSELRLWLAVIADDPTEDVTAVEPLPNLDCLVRQGDSLADPLALIARMPFGAGAMGSTLADLRRVVVASSGLGKKDAARALRHAECAAMKECLSAAEHALERRINEVTVMARTPDLFGQRQSAGACHTRIRELRAQWIPIRQARRRLEREGEVPWFQFEAHFADIFARRGGFDLVVGNPPWVRAEHLAPVVREQLAERYHWWRTEAGPAAKGYRHQPDLSVAFLERAHELAAPGGIVGLIVPAKIATAGYGAAARRGLARDLTLHLLSDLTTNDAQFDATVYPMMIVSGKARPPRDHVVRLVADSAQGPCIRQDRLEPGAPWILRNVDVAPLASELSARFPPLGQSHRMHLGVKTGANDVFLDFPEDIEPHLIRPAIRGRDVSPFTVTKTIPLLWPCNDQGEPLECLPQNALNHFQKHRNVLLARTDYKRGPAWTLFRTGPAMAPCRVVWPDLALRLTAVALTGPKHAHLIPLNTCYVMPVTSAAEANATAAFLNSTWARALARLGADVASGGFARFNVRAIARLPFPPTVPLDRRLADFARDDSHPSDQETLDELAAAHFDLSAAERRILASVAGVGARYRG